MSGVKIRRPEFLQLTGLTCGGLKSLMRRQQLPIDFDQNRDGRGYYMSDVLSVLVCRCFSEHHGIDLTTACAITRSLQPKISENWELVRDRVENPAYGSSDEEVLCGAIFGELIVIPVCGPILSISNTVSREKIRPNAIIVTSISKLVFDLMEAVDELGLETDWFPLPQRLVFPRLIGTEGKQINSKAR